MTCSNPIEQVEAAVTEHDYEAHLYNLRRIDKLYKTAPQDESRDSRRTRHQVRSSAQALYVDHVGRWANSIQQEIDSLKANVSKTDQDAVRQVLARIEVLQEKREEVSTSIL